MSRSASDGEPIGAVVKRLRRQRNLTQEALAERVGCSRSLIQQIENGKRIPPRLQREKLSAVLGERLPGLGEETDAEAAISDLRIRFDILLSRKPDLADRVLTLAQSLAALDDTGEELVPLREIAERQLARAEEVLIQIPSGSVVVREWNTVIDWLTVLDRARERICAIHSAELGAIGGDVGDEYHRAILAKAQSGVSVQRVYVLDDVVDVTLYEDKLWQQVKAKVETILVNREFAPNAQGMLIVDDSYVLAGDYDFRRRERDSSRFSSLWQDVQAAHRKFNHLRDLRSFGKALVVNDLVERTGLARFERLDQEDCRGRFQEALRRAWTNEEPGSEGAPR
ncbi:helix-turn-helix transcriptional regulator [Nocardia aurantiaca]|uniref:Helix-turn-helix domain-containing protein n=1 Tax=Nocardia aurantiaca TaxID=2675850 RepID=A0A6I3L622_9NOCA|nr:helix-turn-helix transcriptional regulator [Nocardia aurantiaca]MTE15975.1 helix-turn-helix domain-containing protein [Nocardia aurantiaca]